MPQTRFATYPDAKVVDDAGDEVQHLIWGDWVRVEDPPHPTPPPAAGLVRVRARGVSGWMDPQDLQEERIVEIVFVDVGQGDGCLLVTPDDDHVVIDAGVSDNMYRFLRWRYAGFEREWRFAAAVISHPDSDHYTGFRPLFDEDTVSFGAVYHNGIMEERGSDPLGPQVQLGGQWYLSGLMTNQDALEAFLSDTSRWQGNANNSATWKRYPKLMNQLLDESRVDDIAMLSTTATDTSFVPGFGGNDPDKVRLEILGPLVEFPDGPNTPMLRQFGDTATSKGRNRGKTKNGHSVVLKLRYRDVSVLLGGDLNQPAEHFLLGQYTLITAPFPYSEADERQLIDAAGPTFGSDVVKSCHHGSADVTDAMLGAINSVATVVSSGDDESYAHPRPETLGALGRHGRGQRPLLFSTELMRSTREDEGDAREERAALVQSIRDAESAGDTDRVEELEVELAKLDDRIFGRNVAVYGAINLRTDGHRVVMAYKLEREAKRGGRLTKWDLYRMEPVSGVLTYLSGDH